VALEEDASLFVIYKLWRNKLDGFPQHQRDGGGDKSIRNIVWGLGLQDITMQYNKTKKENRTVIIL